MSEIHSPAAVAPTFPGGRLDGLDALRGIAMLSGLLLHAAVAYMPTRMPHLLWPVFDDQTSILCDVVFWGLHAFRLPTFFFLSGFFAEYMYQSRGPQKFLEHRIKRLIIPYAASVTTILPLTLGIWLLGWFTIGRCSIDPTAFPFVSLDSDLQANFFNPGHLWFLYDLIVMSVSFWYLRQEWPSHQRASQSQFDWLAGPVLTPAFLAMPASMILWASPAPVTEFNNSFLPDAGRLVYFSIFFTVGVVAFRRREEFFQALRLPGIHLAISMACVAGMFLFLKGEINGTGNLLTRLCFSWCVGLSAWFFIFGAMGVVVRCGQFNAPSLRFLADSSYWMYLIHLPLVGLTHIALREMPLPPEAKMLLTFAIAVAVGLGSYAVFVRYTFIGTCLHGHRRRAAEVTSSSDDESKAAAIPVTQHRTAA